MNLALLKSEGIVLAVEASEPASPSNVGFGSVVLLIAVAALMTWMAYLWLNSRRARRLEETPANLEPGISDDELETSKLSRILSSAVVSAAVLSAVMGVYYANESGRQAAAAEKIHERDVEEGEKWFEFFSCINCHGPGAVGGGAEHVEARSELSTSWAAPSLNDVFYRYSEDEITEFIVYGRSGTPMPASGLDGGGAMTKQEVEQVIEYLRSLQISQGEAIDEVNGAVEAALNRLANAESTIETLIAAKQAEIEDIEGAPSQFGFIDEIPSEIRLLLSGDGTCTEESANLIGATCGKEGADTDRDGLSTQVEVELNDYIEGIQRVLKVRQAGTLALVRDPRYDIIFDADDAFTNEDAEGNAIPDIDSLDSLLTALDGSRLTLSVTAERNDVFLTQARQGLAYLEQALADRAWEVDLNELSRRSGLSLEDTERSLGLFNAYCARCHTAGYSAGVAFQQRIGSGAWGPSLLDGRSVIQFPDAADQVGFIISGSEFAVNYGLNGLGSGRMPGFGQILSTEDIELIVQLERAL
ncbi:MAG: c-type cytochrome [Acidimicrobiia bacterium]|nr:c-type cytochrome [Acidimicrobiia bacterium]